ncbi:MAG: nucleotidyltransferase family protein [Myxococcota bacterium]
MILAAGLGTRLRPLSALRAKPALPVLGRPVISLLLELLARHGVREVLINLHHLPETIRSAVAGDCPDGIEVEWSEEPRPLGTGGGIRRAADFLRGSPECVVLAGDMLFDADLAALARTHRRSGRGAIVLRDDPRADRFPARSARRDRRSRRSPPGRGRHLPGGPQRALHGPALLPGPARSRLARRP